MMTKPLHAVAVLAAVAASAGASANLMYASGVANFSQGLQKNNAAVPLDRSNPAKALGAPQNNDTMNFVSLGFGGSLVLTFDTWFGGSVTVWETTYGNPSGHKEAADVFVGYGSTWDTAQFWHVGLLQNTADGAAMSLALAEQASGREAFNFLKIVDATNPAFHGASGDGFDVDGVMAELRTVPAPGGVALAAALGCCWMRRRRA